ncbi:reverse transcriptase [Elysia marginata]|uniref:Reverse transcriptase n=1 Tax=Elysia marginata TaxID=1093978 RepID=A0AAV4I5C8_9GAST|nr:reverse transcriptase [Elysia marginata]
MAREVERDSTQRKGLLGGYDDWEVSPYLREWDKHPDVIRRTTLRPDDVIHSSSNNSSSWWNWRYHMKEEWNKPIPT